MKITDLALIFIGILLPMIIIVYVNVSFTIKAEEQEMYYTKIINAAAQDAANQMKEVESQDGLNDYGYSGLQNNKVNISPEIAQKTFFNSLYNNFGIRGNEAAEQYLQTFVPALAIIDYDGVYISSMGNDNKHVIRPKRYYSFTYSIKSEEFYEGIQDGASSVHTIEFTMDDYITHRSNKTNDVKSFYIDDTENNADLFGSVTNSEKKQKILDKLHEKRKEVIINTITKELTAAVNRADSYAKSLGISYEFSVPTLTYDDMENAIKNVGVYAFVQGLNNGNKFLNAKAYGATELQEARKYYFSLSSGNSKYKLNLYHKDTMCPEYELGNHNGKGSAEITPTYVQTKQQAASAKISYKEDSSVSSLAVEGFYPCPICKP